MSQQNQQIDSNEEVKAISEITVQPEDKAVTRRTFVKAAAAAVASIATILRITHFIVRNMMGQEVKR